VRFGNVLGSSGSVTGVFKRQIELGEPVTVTSREMTRFIMLLPQAVNLVFKAAELAKGGETFILKMPCLKIVDLAEVMIDNLVPTSGMFPNVCETKIVGARHGEKLYEELMTSYEANSCIEAPDMFILLPPGNDLVDCEKNKVVSPCGYSSKNMSPLNKAEIEDLLKKAGII
jgi:FlaA1/EpsC-like NDP-sugar epimerase